MAFLTCNRQAQMLLLRLLPDLQMCRCMTKGYMSQLFLGFTKQVAHLLPLLLGAQVCAQLQTTSIITFIASRTHVQAELKTNGD